MMFQTIRCLTMLTCVSFALPSWADAGAKVLTCDVLAKLNLPAVQIRRAVVQEASD